MTVFWKVSFFTHSSLLLAKAILEGKRFSERICGFYQQANHQSSLQHMLGKVMLPRLLEHPHRSERGQRGQSTQASQNKVVGYSLSVGLRDG